MTIRRASLILPCSKLDDFPTHLKGQAAAELLAAWTALWHPALIHATGSLPGWHPADSPPDPAAMDGELVLLPSVSRQYLAGDWCDRLRAGAPRNPPPVEAAASRDKTIAAALAAAHIAPNQVPPETAADFLALGYAHLQVELLTRAMRYTSILDTDQFSGAVVAAAHAAVAHNDKLATEELGRAFDLLADARNHVYAVEIYVVDVTLLAATTLGESLRSKLTANVPTSVLASGELIERLARDHPATLAELRNAMSAGTAGLVGGMSHAGNCASRSPESLLADIENGQQTARNELGREFEIFGQFDSSFSAMLPEVLAGMGFRAALHTVFDGGRLPRAEQCKTRWGLSEGAWLEALSTTPLDVAQPETWLTYAERVGDTIAHDHVATVLLAGWPGQAAEYFDDLRRSARFNPVLGKLVTLEEYFRASRETDDWTSFFPREYRARPEARAAANPISTPVRAYRRDVLETHARIHNGLRSIAELATRSSECAGATCSLVLNPWNFECAKFLDRDPLDFTDSTRSAGASINVPGCGYALRDAPAAAPGVPPIEGHVLRNEQLELTVNTTTGGIQSLRMHRDRSTRVSQRLVFHDEKLVGRAETAAHDGQNPRLDTQMIADRVDITRNDPGIGEITSQGRLLDSADEPLARFTQTVRIARGLPAALIEVQLDPQRPLEGDVWRSYFASRLAWVDEGVTLRCGSQWLARQISSEQIESPEWVEITSDVGNIVCFALGLPLHRHVQPTWLDTLLVTPGETERRFQFAIGLACPYPTQAALALLTAGAPTHADLALEAKESRGWFLHFSARNVVVTHVEPLAGDAAGIRCRILETEGRAVETTVSAFRAFRAARVTDFRGRTNEVLSVVEGQVRLDLGPHRWLQLEAEW